MHFQNVLYSLNCFSKLLRPRLNYYQACPSPNSIQIKGRKKYSFFFFFFIIYLSMLLLLLLLFFHFSSCIITYNSRYNLYLWCMHVFVKINIILLLKRIIQKKSRKKWSCDETERKIEKNLSMEKKFKILIAYAIFIGNALNYKVK